MVHLGFVDEPITKFYADQVDFTTNKLGGFPDWIKTENIKKITCNVCGSVIPLLVQIYAPIKERIHYHRTLYVFACINPNCWGNPSSWRCIKNQTLIKENFKETVTTLFTNDWCSDADNWDCNELCSTNELSLDHHEVAAAFMNRVSIDEENANELPDVAFMEAKSCIPTAEIEPDENEPITVDSPVLPNCNLVSLLKQKPTSPKTNNANIYFIPSFIYATEEKVDKDPLSEHVQNLLSEYTKHDKNSLKITNNLNVAQQSDERYEKSQPAHGDKLFHVFLSRIKLNSEQILRYSHSNSAPLFLYTESGIPTKCKHCHGELVFEMQILPTVINYLKLSEENRNHRDHLEFGSAFVYTCKSSCDNSEEECVIVQSEQF